MKRPRAFTPGSPPPDSLIFEAIFACELQVVAVEVDVKRDQDSPCSDERPPQRSRAVEVAPDRVATPSEVLLPD